MDSQVAFYSTGIEVSVHHSHTLFNPEELIEKNGGEAPKSMGQFQSLMSSMGEVPKPVADPPKQFPPLPKDAQTKATEIPTLKDLKYAESKSPYRVSPPPPFPTGGSKGSSKLVIIPLRCTTSLSGPSD